jgi:hypothetical protein
VRGVYEKAKDGQEEARSVILIFLPQRLKAFYVLCKCTKVPGPRICPRKVVNMLAENHKGVKAGGAEEKQLTRFVTPRETGSSTLLWTCLISARPFVLESVL